MAQPDPARRNDTPRLQGQGPVWAVEQPPGNEAVSPEGWGTAVLLWSLGWGDTGPQAPHLCSEVCDGLLHFQNKLSEVISPGCV